MQEHLILTRSHQQLPFTGKFNRGLKSSPVGTAGLKLRCGQCQGAPVPLMQREQGPQSVSQYLEQQSLLTRQIPRRTRSQIYSHICNDV